jgi:hypothetical protein
MTALSRRNFIRTGVGLSLLGSLAPLARGGAAGQGTGLGLPALGKIKPRTSQSIAASPLSIGFETLDRKMFDPERTYPHLAQLGVKWARVHTGWCRTELKRGEFEFAWLDAVVDRLLKIGIQPWFCVGFGNRLYMPEAPFESAVGWIPTRTEEARRAWLRYVGALTEHYRNRVKHFEIWNEPQGKSFWRPDEPGPAKYVELVKLTAPAIRERQRDAVIIGGAVAGMDTKYFQGCMEAGLGEYIQKASFHSYRPLPEFNYEADVRQWRKLIAKHQPGIALWHGEVGAASETGGAGGRANYPWSETRQAKWLLRRFLSDLRMQIELVSYFHTVDLVNYFGSEGPSGKTNFKGLLRGTDYTPKPAYFTYQCLCALFDADTGRVEVPLTFQSVAGAGPVQTGEIACASFSRKGRALHAYWHPCGHEMERADESITLAFPSRPDARLTQPVLVDPLTATVHEFARAEQHGDQWTFTGAPLADHPLLVTDRSVALPHEA